VSIDSILSSGEPTLQYVRQLEDRITHLEQERTRHQHGVQVYKL